MQHAMFRGHRSTERRPSANGLPRPVEGTQAALPAGERPCSTKTLDPTSNWIAALHISACRRWLALDPLPADEISRTVATLIELVEVLDTNSDIRKSACPFDTRMGLRDIDPDACRELLGRIEDQIGFLQTKA